MFCGSLVSEWSEWVIGWVSVKWMSEWMKWVSAWNECFKWMSQWVSEWLNWMSYSVSQWVIQVNESVSEWVKWVSEWVKCASKWVSWLPRHHISICLMHATVAHAICCTYYNSPWNEAIYLAIVFLLIIV